MDIVLQGHAGHNGSAWDRRGRNVPGPCGRDGNAVSGDNKILNLPQDSNKLASHKIDLEGIHKGVKGAVQATIVGSDAVHIVKIRQAVFEHEESLIVGHAHVIRRRNTVHITVSELLIKHLSDRKG